MKKIFFLFFFGVHFYCFPALQAQNSDILKAQETVKNFFGSIAALDVEMMSGYVATDFLLLEDGEVMKLNDLVVEINKIKTYNVTRVNTINFLDAKQHDDVIWLAYDNTADLSMADQKMQLKWLESAVLIKERGQWKIELLHATSKH